MHSFRSPTFGCSYSMVMVFLASFALLGCIFHSNLYYQIDRKDCQFTYMQPKFYKLLGFDRERTAFAGKYGLLLFRDQYDYRLPVPASMLTEYANSVYTIDKEAKVQPLGIPALFIPGNAGSAKQMRSIAKEASKYYYENLAEGQRDGKTSARPIDFFTVDFNEEFSALHGHSLLEQAQYLNDAIAYILSLYQDERHSDPSLPRPTSVVIVGHSMGGIVARSLFTMSNYQPGSVNTILTAATPHMIPPVTLDFEISNIYNTIESFWTRGFQGLDGPLNNVSLISIAGGNLDIVVSGDSGNIHNIVPQTNGFTVFTSSIPHAWVGSDHLSILWCNQIAAVIGKTLIEVVDARYAQQVKPLEERMKIFRNRFLTGTDDRLDEQSTPKEEEEVIVVAEIAHTFITSESGLVFPPRSGSAYDPESDAAHLFIMRIPVHPDMDTFNLLTDHTLGPDSRLDVLVCNDLLVPGRSKPGSPTRLSCHYNTLSAIPIPSSPSAQSLASHPGRSTRGQEFRFISQRLMDLEDIRYIAILDRGHKMGDAGFLIAQYANEANATTTVETSTFGLLNDGLRVHGFPERPTLVSTLRLPLIDNSLLTYTLNVDRQGCHVPERFSPMLRQSSWTMYEDRYTVNIDTRPEGVDINFHGDMPYYERIQLPGKKGIELRFWMDPNCPVPLSLNLQVDKYGSMGKVVIRYRMVVLVFTFLVVVLTLRAQFRAFNKGKSFIPFGIMLSKLIRTTFWKFSLLLAGIAFLQSLLSKPTFSFKNSTRTPPLGAGNAAEEIIHGSGGSGSTAREGLMLMVWIRNLSVQWYEPFSSDHRLDYIAPFIFFVEAITDGAMIPRTPEKGYAAVTMALLNYMIVFLIMYGVRYSWQIYFMSRIWIVWLLILQLKDKDFAKGFTKAVESRLVVGSANGDLRNLCAKVGTMQAKHGPFNILFCTGNFFAQETPIEVIDELLEDKLDFPITTYFMHGDNGVPGIIERTAKRKNGEVCNNLFYLGKHGTMTTAESVKMASLSGTYDSAVYEADTEQEDFDKSLLHGRYIKQDILALTQTAKPSSIMDTSKRGVDIFLSHEWPAGINKLVGPTLPPPEDLPLSTFSHPVANAVSLLQPRYHFASSSGKFWERAPYKNVHGAEHATRFIALGDVGNKNKQRWFYAFNLVPLANVGEDVLKASVTPTTTDSPLATASELKRRPEQEDATGFFWDPKRVRNEPPAGYICHRCNQPGHFVKECTAERVKRVPDGYVCNKCNQSGHYIKDCPLMKEEIAAREQARAQGEQDVPPSGYVCKKCNEGGHYLKDCALIKEELLAREQAREQFGPNDVPPPEYVCVKCKGTGHYVRNCTQFSSLEFNESLSGSSNSVGKKRGKNGPKEYKARELDPCWFCLSNPNVDKNLIVSIGTEVYMAMSKGQLPETPSSLVPGGGHVLLIGINHISSFGQGAPEALSDINSELRKYKEGIRRLYESKGAGMVTWELSQGGLGQHAHIQIMPVPFEKIDTVEQEFKARISQFFLANRRFPRDSHPEGLSSSSINSAPHRNNSDCADVNGDTNMEETSQEPSAAWLDRLPAGIKEGFFRVELPGDRVMVCPIPTEQRVDMQFGRTVLADVLGLSERAHWKRCVKTSEEERKDSNAFKAEFRPFDFTL
ncbi:GPI inositol deacylase [Mortierella sp. AD032]|nr:GPI inositol deacylase [Mortierella sp. AD032]